MGDGGDDNRNATVDVSYRRAGDSQWRDALPLLRMGGEKIFRAPYTVPDRFAGSILDLDPDTAYEVRLTMKDPDGVSGPAVQLVKVRTRGEPKAATGGRILHAYPPTWRGAKEEPSFTGLMAHIPAPAVRRNRCCEQGWRREVIGARGPLQRIATTTWTRSARRSMAHTC